MLFRLLLLCSIMVLVASAEKANRYEELEKPFGTDTELDRDFHVITHDRNGIGLRFSGYLVGIEKADRRFLGLPKNAGLSDENRLRHETIRRMREDSSRAEIVKEMEGLMNDKKRTFVSHIVKSYITRSASFPKVQNEFLYNIYSNDESVSGHEVNRNGKHHAYEKGWTALESFGEAFHKEVEKVKPTHVIVASMGWNTSQEKSIRNFNSLILNIADASRRDGSVPFKPMFIGITWPSYWKFKLGSFANKAHDADEIGLIWGNYILNKIASSRSWTDENRYKVIAIGHSFGARLLSRSAFSKEFMFPTGSKSSVDYLILLQAAFSMNRFLKNHKYGQEGAPYRNFAGDVGSVIMTWSEHDTANPIANKVSGGNYVGGKPGYKRALDYPQNYNFLSATKDGSIALENNLSLSGHSFPPDKLNYINAGSLIRYNMHQTGGGSHSDIYTDGMGTLIWNIIKLNP